MGSALTDRELLARSLGILHEDETARIDGRLASDAEARARAQAIEAFFSTASDISVSEDWQKILDRMDDQGDGPPVSAMRHPGLFSGYRWRGLFIGSVVAAGLALVLLTQFSTNVLTWKDADGSAIANGVALRAPSHTPRVIGFGVQSRVSLAPGSVATLTQHPGADSQLVCELALLSGSVDVEIEGKMFARFDVRAGRTLVRVTGTSFSVSQGINVVMVAVSRGHVAVSFDGGKIYAVRAGSRASVTPDGKVSVHEMRPSDPTNASDGQKVTRAPGQPMVTNNPVAVTTNTPAPDGTAGNSTQECIMLKDGAVFRGRIIHMDNLIVRIETAFGTYDIKQSQILRVQYK